MVLTLAPIALASLLAAQGEVKLPLRDYLAMVQRAEELERAQAAAVDSAEPAVAELASQRASIVWENDGAELTTVYEVQIQGAPATGVSLPLTGLALAADIRPRANASLQSVESGLQFVGTVSGRYRVEVRSRAGIETSGGVSRLRLSPFVAPVGDFDLSLPADLVFHCPGAVVAEDVVRDGRRHVRFALPRGSGGTIEVRRSDLMGAEAEALLASAVVVTLVDLRVDGVLRHDIVLYEVSRGRMESHEVTIPDGLEVERLATDEGPTPPLSSGGVIRVDRKTRLEGTGYLVLTSRPTSSEEIPLLPVVPRTAVRARYLAYASSVAAEVAPAPASVWLRVDLADLPREARAAVVSDVVSAWRLEGAESSAAVAALHVSPRPRAQLLGRVVTDRETLTLLTTDGTLVYRDEVEVAPGGATAFRMRLPDGAALWSVRVDDRLVRPVERDGEILIPLSLGAGDGGGQSIEVIAIRKQAVPAKRARLSVELPGITAPVLAHRFRLMLPEGNRYRYVGGDLTPVVAGAAAGAGASLRRIEGGLAIGGTSRAQGMGGTRELWGQVVDATGLPLPGATVTLSSKATGWSATVACDENGGFSFVALPGGSYRLTARLAGFSTSVLERVTPSSGRTAGYSIQLNIAAVAETVTVTAESPRISSLKVLEPKEDTSPLFRNEAESLRNGLVGGVKPIAILIPESGKLLTLTGALPPATVRVEIEVRPR
jgi:Carboxypeptidase regulatory-like domain